MPRKALIVAASVLALALGGADGCVTVANREMDEIMRAVPDGTPIEIRP